MIDKGLSINKILGGGGQRFCDGLGDEKRESWGGEVKKGLHLRDVIYGRLLRGLVFEILTLCQFYE